MPGFAITLVGGPTALLEIGSLRLLTDPTFDPPGSYPGAVTLTKTAGPALTPDQLGRIDAVLLSHDQHKDNLDHSGREFLLRAPCVFTTATGAQRLDNHARGLIAWQEAELKASNGDSLRLTATPARHGPEGIQPISGEVTGFMISSATGEPLIYVTGDTVWFEGTAEVARRIQPKVVLVFAGSAQARGPFNLTMNTNDVVEAAYHFPNAAIVPVHHHGWEHFVQSQDDLVKTFKALGIADRLHPIHPGERLTFE